MPPKYQTIAEELCIHIRAGKYADAQALPTEMEIAKEYCVSRQTVRQALSVLVEDGLIEKRQGSGSYIRHSPPESSAALPSRNIAVITTYISDYIFPSILREIENVLALNNCTTLLFSTQNLVDNERNILNNLLTARVDGLLVEGSKTVLPNPNLDLYQKFIAQDIPLVFMHGAYSNLPQALSVMDDNKNGGRLLVEYLHKRGHSKIGGIFKSDDIQGLERYEGYTAALRDLGLPLDDRQVIWYNTETKDQILNSYSPKKNGATEIMLDKIQRLLEDCTAIVCYNDEIANFLVSSLLKKGIRIPEDVAVVSFDNSRYSDLSPVPITSLSHGKYNVGKQAAELIISLLRGEACSSEQVPWTLVEKESS